ncbi:MAG: hypothetical protein DHS20C14_22540 [Phycisphaeraceae bacterium]|nr:MAG: hypothetical protein DHS20C14_22540 [Phycisphaeraceae bacterium]
MAQADWLDYARTLAPGSVDLVYADPPFNTGKTQSGRASKEPRPSGNGQIPGESGPSLTLGAPLAYGDSWDSTGAWVAWLRERLLATLPALKPTGSILLHVDWRTSHYARLMLDEVLGADRFVNHLVWAYGLGGSSPRRFARKHDDILFYAIDPERYFFVPPMVPATSVRMKGQMKKATDVLDVPAINNMALERCGYPTQKPVALLDMLVRACCPAGGVVLDPCCGSGTSLVAAVASGRRAIGCDLSADAVRISRERLALVSADDADTRG